ncbi:hypothetical protein FB446DRAFT_748840 [Lentinula raphanica]|nr:hypothetical protein FB446DRAFT_748840 [Lentinula raphanica]
MMSNLNRFLLAALLFVAPIVTVSAAPVPQQNQPTITTIPGQAPTPLATEVFDRQTTTVSAAAYAPTPASGAVLARGMDIW